MAQRARVTKPKIAGARTVGAMVVRGCRLLRPDAIAMSPWTHGNAQCRRLGGGMACNHGCARHYCWSPSGWHHCEGCVCGGGGRALYDELIGELSGESCGKVWD